MKVLLLFWILSTVSNANSYLWNIKIDTESLYSVRFHYLNENNISAGLVEIDGHSIENVNLLPNESNKWKTTYKVTKLLTVGMHNISLTGLHGSDLLIDRLIIDIAEPVKLVIDTDMMTDSDDAGALAVAHALEDNGETKILGVMLSAHDERHYNSNSVKAINNYYNGRENTIKIGIHAPILTLDDSYITENIRSNFRIDSDTIGNMHEAVWNLTGWGDHVYNYERNIDADIVTQYYNILSAEDLADHSLVIAVLGTNFNIESIMKDSRTKELFSKKVKEVVLSAWMDSCNMNMCAVPIPSVRSDSYEAAKRATDYVINDMPEHIKLTVGDVSTNVRKHTMRVGQDYVNKHIYSPMRVLYEHDCANIDCSQSMLDEGNYIIDALAVLVAVRGLSYKNTKYFDMHFNGNGFLESSFSSLSLASWKITGYKNHRVLKYIENNASYDTMLKNTINGLMMQDSVAPYAYPKTIKSRTYYIGLHPVEALKVQAIDKDTIELLWIDTSSEETGYKLYENGVVIAILGANSTSYRVNNLEKNKNYIYTIKTVKDEIELYETTLHFTFKDDFAWLIPLYHIVLD